MQNNLEVFYGEDDKQKIEFCNKTFTEFYQFFQSNQIPQIDPIFFKALNRVLNDDYKRNPELTRVALKNVHLIIKNVSDEIKIELITENSIDNFQWTASKIFVWEFKRLNRIYNKYLEIRKNEKPNLKILKTMNINILKQCKIFTLLILIFREHFNLLNYLDLEINDLKLKEFRDNLINFNLLDHIIKFFDYEDHNLLKTSIYFLMEILDEKIALEIIKKGILYRIYRFLHNVQIPVYNLLSKMFVYSSVRKILVNYDFFLKGIVLALEKNQISNALVILNLISLNKNIVDKLLEYEIDIYLFNLVTLFFKKEESIVIKKKVLWNLLINLSNHPKFASNLLAYKNFNIFFDFLFKTNAYCSYKLIENIFYFSNDHKRKKIFSNHSSQLSVLLEKENIEEEKKSCIINILSEIYNLKERKAISSMMKLMKKSDTNPNIYISSFNFLNKSLYSPNLSKGLVNKGVLDYVMKKYFYTQNYLEDEIKFQFLFFLNNLMIMKNEKVDFDLFIQFIEGFENRNMRFVSIVLNIMDSFLSNAIKSNENIEFIRMKKFEIYEESLDTLNTSFPVGMINENEEDEDDEYSVDY